MSWIVRKLSMTYRVDTFKIQAKPNQTKPNLANITPQLSKIRKDKNITPDKKNWHLEKLINKLRIGELRSNRGTIIHNKSHTWEYFHSKYDEFQIVEKRVTEIRTGKGIQKMSIKRGEFREIERRDRKVYRNCGSCFLDRNRLLIRIRANRFLVFCIWHFDFLGDDWEDGNLNQTPWIEASKRLSDTD